MHDLKVHSTQKIKVILADDHPLIRRGLKSLLELSEEVVVVKEAAHGAELLAYLGDVEVDVIVMDISMPKMDGLETTKRIKALFPEIKIIALSMYSQEGYIRSMLNAGADTYLIKSGDSANVLEAIKTVHQGEQYVSEEVSKIMMLSYRKGASRDQEIGIYNPDLLTQREREILGLVATGMTTKEIADKLSISNRTVDTHRRNLMQKVGVRNSAGLVKYAYLHNLV